MEGARVRDKRVGYFIYKTNKLITK